MSIKGRASTWFEGAVRQRNVAGALAEAAELRPLGIEYALALTVLLGETRDPRFQRAAARWIARFALECRRVDIRDVEAALVAFAWLPYRSVEARQLLVALGERHDLKQLRSLL